MTSASQFYEVERINEANLGVPALPSAWYVRCNGVRVDAARTQGVAIQQKCQQGVHAVGPRGKWRGRAAIF